MKINKEQEVVMEVHKQKDSKIHKKSDGKIKSKVSRAKTKGKMVAGSAGNMIADNIEGGENIKASLEAGRTVARPVADTMSAGNRIRKKIKNSKVQKEIAGGRLRKQASKRGKKLVKDRFKKSSKKAVKKVAKKTAKETAKESSKLAVKAGAKVGGALAGSAAGPIGTVVGYAAGKAAEAQIDKTAHGLEKKFRMIKYLKDKMQTPDNQNDNIIKLAVDLVKMKAALIIRHAMSLIAPIVIPIVIVIAAVAGIVMAIVTVLYNSPLAFLLPPLSDGETLHSVTTQYVAEFNEKVHKEADEHKDADVGKIVYMDYEGISETPSNYYDIMCVYMVKYGYENTAIEMTEINKQYLKNVVNDMCQYSTAVVTETKGKGKKKKTTKTLEVRVRLKTYNDMITEYSFDQDQVKMLHTLMSACNSSSVHSGGSSPSNLQSSLSEKEIKKYTNKISDEKQKKVVEFVLSKVGYEYSQARRFSGTAFDCSSLAYCAWKAAGIDISYNDATTAAAEANGLEKKTVSQSDLKPGDLIFYSYTNNGRYKNISHVGIYVGDGKMVEAMDEAHGVVFGDYHNKGLVMICRPGKKS